MTRTRTLIPVEEWKEAGLSGRIGQLIPAADESPYDAAVASLTELGCCAWRGRTACGDDPAWVAIGGLGLLFLTHRSCYAADSPVVAVLCSRHAGPLSTVSRDMPRSLRHQQEAEFHRALWLMGAMDREDEARMVVLTELEAA